MILKQPLIPPQVDQLTQGKMFDPSPATPETDFDGYDSDNLDGETGELADVFEALAQTDEGVYEDEEVV